ncbi:MAG: type IX secretion system outer membrane channel protein PorV [Bacteroidales bacterium]
MRFVSIKSIFLQLFLLFFVSGGYTIAQNGTAPSGPQLNAIQTAVPFMTITPDSRAGGMGDVGVASEPDINSQYWNSAKYPFMESRGGIALSYTPWLRRLINDINLAYLAGFYKLDDRQVVSAALRYFSLGQIIFTDNYGTPQGIYVPNEFAIDVGYSRLLTDNFSGGIVFRFIRSDLTGGQSVGGGESKAAMAIAGDLGFYYRNADLRMGSKDVILGLGIQIANMGNKVSYTADQEKSFLPINMRLGGALTVNMDDYNSISLMADVNKLLVPTPPVWATDSMGVAIRDADGNQVIAHGKNPFVAVPVGMFQSFYDAPGVVMDDGSRSVWREEINEITYSIGLEYWYRRQFAIRGGYFHEHQTKGNRKYFTIGMGLRLNVFSLDFSYLVPVKQQNPLANTLRFTLGFEFGGN